MKKIVFFSLFSLMIINCSSAPSFQDLSTKSNELYDIAIELEKSDRKEEALRIADVLSGLYANDPKIKELIGRFSAEQKEAILTEGLLGFNQGIRAKVTPSIAERILWYFPDRILDFVEIFDAWVSLGPQFGLGVKATSAVQAEAFVGATFAYGFGQKKMIGFKGETRGAILVGPFGPLAIGSSSVGTGGFQFGADFEYFHTPGKAMYQDIKDYWSIGGRVGVFFWGVEAEVHPIEIIDFMGGIFLLDPLNDDFATTRRLQFTSRQREALKDYVKAVRSFEEEDIKQFRTKFPEIKGSAAVETPVAPAPEVKTPTAPAKKGKK